MGPERAPLRGVLAVLQTPFLPDFSIDVATLRREVDWVFGHGVHGLVLGMVSEVLRLADGERDALVRAVVEAAEGRGPVVASVGAESIPQALRHARAAADAGADALMAMPPLLSRCGEPELLAYYEAILTYTPLPLVVQDASGYLGQPLPIALQAELHRRHGGRVLFKPEPNPAGPAVSALLEATGGKAVIFEGQGGRELLDTYARGAKGTMPGADLPWAFSALWAALERGDAARAKEIHGPLSKLSSLPDTLDAWLAQEKRLLVRQGVFTSARVRAPIGRGLAPGAEAEGDRLFDALRKLCP
jgi:4-hydroxy-tetrahydrodipicolinate synthase